jgi:hypothetical protein
MRPPVWHPPVELSPVEQTIVKRIRRAKFFVFLRTHRHELFSDEFQVELAAIYEDSPFGQPPVPPAQLALATILQAYVGDSDDWVVENTVMDRRWQLVLDCHDCAQAPFSKGTLVGFRKLLIEHNLDRRLIERTVELAAKTGEFGARPLRGALDSSPLWGAGRVEDTYNLLGHALRKALGVIARQQGRGLAEVASAAQADLLGQDSLKAVLDLDWDDPEAKLTALQTILATLDRVEVWLAGQDKVPTRTQEKAQESLAVAKQVKAQDVELGSDGRASLIKGVAKERRISVEDSQMRHGRKSRSQRIDGYKRHVLRDLDTGLVRAVGITPANVPEASVTDDILADLKPQQVELVEAHLDRAYLSSSLVRDRGPNLAIYCKAWPVRNGERFPKTAFHLDWDNQQIRCPNDVAVSFKPGGVVHFPEETCLVCPLRVRCTASVHGRSVSIHPDERLLFELRQRQLTPEGRAKLRQRVAVEHSLAHIGRWQGRRARYLGTRKNLFDSRRSAVVHNLHVIASLPAKTKAA